MNHVIFIRMAVIHHNSKLRIYITDTLETEWHIKVEASQGDYIIPTVFGF